MWRRTSAATPFALVPMTQSHPPTTIGPSSIGSVSISGQSTGSNPCLRSAAMSGSACARGRVTITRISVRDEGRQCRRDFTWVLAAAPLDPAAVLRCHERGEPFAVVVGGDRGETTATDHRDARPLGLDAAPRVSVIRRCDEILLAGSHLERKSALTRFRHHHAGVEAKTDLACETETVETASRQHDRVETALPALAQTRIDVAAQWFDRKGRLESEELCTPSDRCGADAHPGAEPGSAAERVTGILALEVGTDHQPVRVRRSHVFRGMNRNVDPPREQRL